MRPPGAEVLAHHKRDLKEGDDHRDHRADHQRARGSAGRARERLEAPRPSSSFTGSGCCRASWADWDGLLRSGRLRVVDAGAGPTIRRRLKRPGEPGRLRQEDCKAGRRSHQRGHRCLGQETSRNRTLDRGLVAQMLAGRGLSAATVAIDPGPFRGVLPLPPPSSRRRFRSWSTRSRAAARSRSRSTSSSTAGRTRWTRRRRRSSTTRSTSLRRDRPPADGQREPQPAERGEGGHEEPRPWPLLIIEGEKDHTVPWSVANAAYKRQKRNPGVTEIVKMPGRGARADDRPRLAGSRREGARLRQGGSIDLISHLRQPGRAIEQKPITCTMSSTSAKASGRPGLHFSASSSSSHP